MKRGLIPGGGAPVRDKLVNITPISRVYGRYTELLFMGGMNQLIAGERR